MQARGFTLVEVMVALAVVAIALPAVLMALYQQTDDTAYLRDKSLAHMVAANKLAEIRLVVASSRNLSAGKDSGQSQLTDRDWYWWVETKTTEVPQFYRVEIRVALEEDPKTQPLYTLTAFMSGDLLVDPEGLQTSPGDDRNPDESDPGNPRDPDDGGTQTLPNLPDDVKIPDGLQLDLPTNGN